jgi:thioesterase domain-containing protein
MKLIAERAVRTGIAPPGAGTGMVTGMASVYRASLHALSRFTPKRLKAGLTLFRTDDLVGAGFGLDGGWQAIVEGPVRVRTAEGTHTTMVRAPHAASLAASIAEELDRPGD